MKLLACSGLAIFLWLAGSVAGLATPTGISTAPDANRNCYTASCSIGFTPLLDNPFPPVYFCGEAVPLHEEAVARRLISALSRNAVQARSMMRLRQRATAFFSVIEPVLAKYNIPPDFKYLPLVESALVGTAVSVKGAAGFWQLMPDTARELGLTVDNTRDDRLNLMRSTDAACRYLRFLYSRLGSWTLAAAAYNNGIGNLLSSIHRQQKRNYYYLRLNAETGKYLYRILAFKELFTHPVSYRELIPEPMLASLNQPVTEEIAAQANEVLFDEKVMVNLEREAVSSPLPLPTLGQAIAEQRPDDLPLPNAADVFRGGIKAKLLESGALQRGSVWVFNLTRTGMVDDVTVSEGDRLYAVVEDIDPKTNRVYFRADKIYTNSQHETLNLPLIAVDASTGRMGIKLPDLNQLKTGWILTWKAL
ncbi:lytic transglycosylase domain-containing protein [Fibrella sp. WM1]|uniref:lytic transglycosylase domain-containing protein n=1 Tax=Fibrella musci TaxID=3242485 RepID=UPI003521AAB5